MYSKLLQSQRNIDVTVWCIHGKAAFERLIHDTLATLGDSFTEKAIFCAKTQMLHKSISGDLSSYLDWSIVEFTAKIRKNTTSLFCGTDSQNLVYDADSSKSHFNKLEKIFIGLYVAAEELRRHC